ncbi:hypothetical protein [Salipiger thiooxidans]|uniref:hypothetical protein n=1 Tax=Salipiger thiooxidans TaxID=282683 RepID=UPI001CFC3A0E|nr:hypothetical protein [Salipiger thiooxidans]
MTSPHEAAILALQASIDAHAATVIRESDFPAVCPAAGLINLVPMDPEEQAVRLGVGVSEWQRVVELETIVQAATEPERSAALDTALAALASLLAADCSLSGAVDWLVMGAPQQSDAVPMQGAETLKGAVLPVTLFYETTTANPME